MHPGERDVAARDAASQATSHHIFIFRAIPYTGEAQLEEDPPDSVWYRKEREDDVARLA